MALFGSSKTATKQSIVKPTVVRTQNVAKEIQKIAQSYNVPANSLDFTVLEVISYTRMKEQKGEAEWGKISNKELHELDETLSLLNPDFEIKQTYEIEIFPLDEKTNIFPDLKLAIGANASKCKVYASISANSKIKNKPNLDEDLLEFLNKKKVRAGILIYIFDEMLKDIVSKLSARAQVEGIISFEKAETLLVSESFEPTPTRDDALILHYEDTENDDEHDQVDYASRGFIRGVKKDELLIEYIKPLKGESGRNCRGEFLAPSEPIIANEVAFTIDETIREEEDESSVKYLANDNGYIALEGNSYSIKNEMDIGEISFKTTGSIKSGVDSDVNLNVNEKDANKDAIGSGMEVEVSEIEIDGNVGSNARVLALKASVGGQTHKTSFIKADTLDINIHKGKAEGKEINITRLEHGEVEGDSVDIGQALGGSIRAKVIHIALCASHVKATATKLIEIKKLQGSENTFTIDPLLKKDIQESLTENKDTISELNSDVKSLKKEIATLQESIKKGMPAFLDIKKRLIHYKKNGVKLPASFVKQYKNFMNLEEALKELKVEYKGKNENLLLHTTRTSSFQDNILDARVINRDRWVGYNEIKFKLVDPPIELVHKPAEGSKDMIFGLVEDEEGEYKIEAMTE